MYPLAHIGIALLLGKLLKRRLKLKDMRLVALGSMLPDIIDKPLTILGVGSGRFVAHSLLFTIFVSLLSREVGFGCVNHLLLDRIWEEPKVLFLPFLGIPPTVHHTIYDFIRILLTDRTVQLGEVVGTICLIVSWRMDS